jgi:hypothetical protein
MKRTRHTQEVKMKLENAENQLTITEAPVPFNLLLRIFHVKNSSGFLCGTISNVSGDYVFRQIGQHSLNEQELFYIGEKILQLKSEKNKLTFVKGLTTAGGLCNYEIVRQSGTGLEYGYICVGNGLIRYVHTNSMVSLVEEELLEIAKKTRELKSKNEVA